MGREVTVELTQGGKCIGRLEKDGNVWYWEAYDKDGAYAAGWEWSEMGALVKRAEAEERKGT